MKTPFIRIYGYRSKRNMFVSIFGKCANRYVLIDTDENGRYRYFETNSRDELKIRLTLEGLDFTGKYSTYDGMAAIQLKRTNRQGNA